MMRVRFAPSPTGYLHVGGARTALFNWLLARRNHGVFVLRLEDTDLQRSSTEMVEQVLEGMRWLGLDWDEGPGVGGPYGPYFQSERIDQYRASAERLVSDGHAYYCYCTTEELKARRDEAERDGGAFRYDRRCAELGTDEIARRERDRLPRVVRLRVPDGPLVFDDLVHGAIEVDASTLDDFIVLRTDGTPTYHLTVVSDDVGMRITHVVRGDDHISNTPKQILLYRALGESVPQFAHVPLILGPDRKRLSKRHGATSVVDYARRGYLPEAMMNFLALLGWSPGSDRELFTRGELVEVFDLAGVSGGNAVFNPEKLDWFNQQHIARLPAAELLERLQPWFTAAGVWDDRFLSDRREWFLTVLELLKPRAKRLDEFADVGRFFFVDGIDYDERAVAKHLSDGAVVDHLRALGDAFDGLAVFDAASTESVLRSVAETRGCKAGTLIHAVRVAVTGRSASPGLFEVLELIGRERVRSRLEEAVKRVPSGSG
jgi:glutamyl-tRNA synthetase